MIRVRGVAWIDSRTGRMKDGKVKLVSVSFQLPVIGGQHENCETAESQHAPARTLNLNFGRLDRHGRHQRRRTTLGAIHTLTAG